MILDLKQTDYYETAKKVKERISGLGLLAHVITFGCQQNEADSEKIRGMLCDMGYSLSDRYEECDIIIVNTCAIRSHAEMKALSMLGNFGVLKKKKPDLIVGVMGCMAAEPGIADKLKKDFHYVSFTVEPNMLYRLPSLVLSYIDNSKRSFIIGEDEGDLIEGLPIRRIGGHRAWVSIMYGCNNFCSYCIVPYVRGRERSRPSALVIDECRELIKEGVKEITLLGQNVNSYRSDMTFSELLENIACIDGDFIIRFMTSHPKDASCELISVMKRYKGKVAPFFHLPLQSGSDKILKSMNRTYDRERYLEVARGLKEAIPDIALSTDVIIGFPGEDDTDFSDTMDVLQQIKFDVVYSFLFSPREGTAAAKMEQTIPDGIKSARMNELLALQDSISLERNLPYVDKIVRILVDSVSKRGGTDTYTGRTDTNKLVHFKSEKNRIGEFIKVKITRAGAYDLFAEEI